MKGLWHKIHHLFVPKESNNYRAKSLHVDSLTVYLVLVLVGTIFLQPFKNNTSNVLGYATDITTNKLLELTNKQRTDHQLSPLTYNDKLSSAAYQKSQDMFKKNYWAHFAPDGTSPWDFINSSGYHYEFAGENLAKNFLFSNGVVDAWMNSPSHRENILRREYTDVGFAIANGVLNGEQTTLVVQMFGKPEINALTKQMPAPPHEVSTSQTVLAEHTKSIVSIPKVAFNINIIFIIFLLLALVLDFYFASKLKLPKVGGKNIAHIIFMVFILLGVIILAKGAIL